MGLRKNVDKVLDKFDNLVLGGNSNRQQPTQQYYYPGQHTYGPNPAYYCPQYPQGPARYGIPSAGHAGQPIYPALPGNLALQYYAPPVPQASKPSSTPPIIPFYCKPPPGNSQSNPADDQVYQQPAIRRQDAQEELWVYWQPRYDPSIPVTEYFSHECGDWGWGNNEAENYTNSSQNSFHSSNHTLVIRAIADSSHSNPQHRYTSARLTSKQRFERDRGYVEARITPPVAKGIWPAFWLLPADPFEWPRDGEVDVMELWNGGVTNHSCLHWGGYGGGEDEQKHRVVKTNNPTFGRQPHTFGFAWDEGNGGRALWYIDRVPVMRAAKPAGTRPWRDFRILLNVAMGGTVCGGTLPADGCYDMTVGELRMCEAPPGGWAGFEQDWKTAKNGSPEG